MSLKAIIRLRVPSAAAKPSPAIGQALGPHGINMMEFCKSFNDRTKNMRPNIPVSVKLSAFEDRSFKFTVGTPSASYLLKKAGGVEKGAEGVDLVGYVNVRQIYEIAKIKQLDQPHTELKSISKSLVGTAKSMGMEVYA